MTYATTAQFVARFTEREAIALTDRDGIGRVDEVQLGDAIASAGAEIDAHLGKRYALPLAREGVPLASAPLVLVGVCCDIARYRLCGTEVQETDAVRNRYRDALALLKTLASGEAVFAESPDLLPASSANAAGGAVAANERARSFGRDTLGGY